MKLIKAVFTVSVLALVMGVRAIYGQDIYIENHQPKITDRAFAATVSAIQSQLDNDLEPAWGVTAHLIIGEAPDNVWKATVNDKVDLFALGYHGVAVAPFAVVFAGEPTYNWQTTLDHELLEMVVDPWTDRLAKADKLWLVEVADPVEAQTYGKWVAVDGLPVLLSDFVTPSWYSGVGDRYDAYGHVHKPWQILPGGFAYHWDHGWRPIYGGRKHATHDQRHSGWQTG